MSKVKSYAEEYTVAAEIDWLWKYIPASKKSEALPLIGHELVAISKQIELAVRSGGGANDDQMTALRAASAAAGERIDALAAQVGGIGIAPGANINFDTGHAIFEATHGTAPKYADQDKVNPGSVILSGEMMFRYIGWEKAADLITKGLGRAIESKSVTYDFHRLMEGANLMKCSEFADRIILEMDG